MHRSMMLKYSKAFTSIALVILILITINCNTVIATSDEFVRVDGYNFINGTNNATFNPIVGNSWGIFTNNYSNATLRAMMCNASAHGVNVYRIFVEKSFTEPNEGNYERVYILM